MVSKFDLLLYPVATNFRFSRGAQRVLYAFRGALSFMIVFGQFECAESKKIGPIIFPTGEHAENGI